jgi:hypothetical protein
MNSITTREGKHDLWKIGLKGKFLGKEKWYSREKVEENFPHLIQSRFWGPKSSLNWEVLSVLDHHIFFHLSWYFLGAKQLEESACKAILVAGPSLEN